MKRIGHETPQRSRRTSRLPWLMAALALLALVMLRGMSTPVTPEASPTAADESPTRRETTSPFIRASDPTLPATRPTQHPAASTPRLAPEPSQRETLNPQVQPEALSFEYPAIAAEFLHFVQLAPNGGGGFRVTQGDPQSVYHSLGVQPGDVIYSTDPPPGSDPDTVFLRAEIKLQVIRDGQPLWLSYRPDQPAQAAAR